MFKYVIFFFFFFFFKQKTAYEISVRDWSSDVCSSDLPGLAGRFDPRRLVRDVLATGPFAQWSRTAVAPGGGAVLVGDAADFFDPFTGQGIYSAMRGAELLAECLISVLTPCPPLRSGEGGRPEFPVSRRERGVGGEDLAPYDRARRREF